jgi:hypothetical protein
MKFSTGLLTSMLSVTLQLVPAQVGLRVRTEVSVTVISDDR